MSRGAAGELAAGLGARRPGSDGAPSPRPGCVSRAGVQGGRTPAPGWPGPRRGAAAGSAVPLCGRARRLRPRRVCAGGALCGGALGSPAAAPIGRRSSESVCAVCWGNEEGNGGERRGSFPDPLFPYAGGFVQASLPGASSRVCTRGPRFPHLDGGRGGRSRRFLSLLSGLCLV